MNLVPKQLPSGVAAALALLLIAAPSPAQTPVVKTGIEVLQQRQFDILKGKRVGLITNPTGVDSRLRSTIDILFHAPEVKLVALFGPEHGARGDFAAGDRVETTTDSATGIPVYSLYGRTMKPTPEMLAGLDVLVYDIQDIGARSYTYITTLGLAMEAAAEQSKEMVVLDRPNPLGGERMEGCCVEKGFESAISPYAIPYVYGLTCGELASMLNGEKMLHSGVQCTLTVVPMEGWNRRMTFAGTGLPWVPTSPHVPEVSSPAYYVSTGVLGELGAVSEGVGYTIPFHLFAAEWIDPQQLADRANALGLPGVLFRPISFRAFYGKYQGRQLRGVQIHIIDEARTDLLGLQFLLMQAHHELYPDKSPFAVADAARLRVFDRVIGSDQVRALFSRRMIYADVKPYLDKDLQEFRKKAERYMLYH